jgi:hypothetical protein
LSTGRVIIAGSRSSIRIQRNDWFPSVSSSKSKGMVLILNRAAVQETWLYNKCYHLMLRVEKCFLKEISSVKSVP